MGNVARKVCQSWMEMDVVTKFAKLVDCFKVVLLVG